MGGSVAAPTSTSVNTATHEKINTPWGRANWLLGLHANWQHFTGLPSEHLWLHARWAKCLTLCKGHQFVQHVHCVSHHCPRQVNHSQVHHNLNIKFLKCIHRCSFLYCLNLPLLSPFIWLVQSHARPAEALDQICQMCLDRILTRYASN